MLWWPQQRWPLVLRSATVVPLAFALYPWRLSVPHRKKTVMRETFGAKGLFFSLCIRF